MSRPRVGFVGTGWIGRHRMEAICASGAVEPAAIADPDEGCRAEAAALAPEAICVPSLEAMLDLALDGIVIATPSALHAEQAVLALNAGAAVFCQKPLGRNAAEVGRVLEAARGADRLLAVDFSYRLTAAATAVRALVEAGELGEIFAADLTFHNAYGPDKPWFYDKALSGGGCVMDLGIHLVDLLLWTLGFPDVTRVASRLYGSGVRLSPGAAQIEDYAAVELELCGGASARLACSWRLHAGCDAVIEAAFHGTRGTAILRNVGGSFYDFEARHLTGTDGRRLADPPDAWGGRAAVAWARRLAEDARYDEGAGGLAAVAAVLDRIYAGEAEPGAAGRVPAAAKGNTA